MVVFFEDGSVNNPLFIDGKEILTVDAGMGFSNCRKRLRYIKDNYPFDTEVYTNSLDAFSNFWSWDEEKKMPMIYIRDKEGKWINICDTCYGKEIRYAHNLEKLYIGGGFDERR